MTTLYGREGLVENSNPISIVVGIAKSGESETLVSLILQLAAMRYCHIRFVGACS